MRTTGQQHRATRGRRGSAGLLAVLCLALPVLAVAQQPSAPSQPAPAAPEPVAPPAAVSPVGAGRAGSPSAADKPAAPVHVRAQLSSDKPLFGDTIQLVVTLTYPSGYRVFFPAKPNLKPFLVDPKNPGTSERQEQAGSVTETFTIPLLVVRSGLVKTPALEIPWHAVTQSGGAGESGTVTVAPLRAVVRSQFAAETEVKPAPLPAPRPLVEENTPLEIALFVLGMMLVAAVLTGLGLRYYRHRAARAQPKPQVPPHLLAFGRLEELQRSGRLAQAEPRLVLGELSEILREYLQGRYGFPALDMTSTELLAWLPRVDLRQVPVDAFRDFTETSDLVKFARMPASPEELQRNLEFVRQVVERTMQTPDELERLRQAEIARLARQRKLRIQVMAPAPLRLRAFALDLLAGALGTSLVAWVAIDTQRQGLFDAAYLLLLAWLALRDALGGGSPGKAMTGLQIAAFDSETATARPPWHATPGDIAALEATGPTARMAPWTARLQRNLLLLVPGGGLVAEALTAWYLPEQRRLGDQWAQTRVIDARHGLRRGKPSWLPAALLLALAVVLLLLPLLLGGRPR